MRETVLIYRLGSLGDTLVALPCFHKIAEFYPNARRIVLTSYLKNEKAVAAEKILEHSGLIHSVVKYPGGIGDFIGLWELRKQVRKFRHATLINLNPRSVVDSWRDYLFFCTCGIRRIVGLPLSHDVASCRRDPISGELEPEIERLCRSLSELGRIELRDRRMWDLNLTTDEVGRADAFLTALSKPQFMVVSVGGKDQQKDWGDENWRSFLNSLSARVPEWAIVFVGSQDEAARCGRLTRAWPGETLNACGQLSPRECAAVLDRAMVFLGHDCGPMHLAASRGTPCVCVFGNYNEPRKWHPYGEGHRIIHNMSGVRAIRPEELLDAALSVIDARDAACLLV